MRFTDVPKLEIALIDRPTEPPLGAGEAATRAGRRGARQRDLRCDRRAPAYRAVHAGAGEGRVEQPAELGARGAASGYDCDPGRRYHVAPWYCVRNACREMRTS